LAIVQHPLGRHALGDVNEGREMQILPGEFDALDTPVIALHSVGRLGRSRDPERVVSLC
jgi:hypothetical protein